MDYEIPDFVVGDVPALGEVVLELPKLALDTAKEIGRGVVELINAENIATSFAPNLAHLARGN